MILYDLAIQGPQNRASVLRSIQKIAPQAQFGRVTGLFAYATKYGVDLLIDALSQSLKNWDSITKRWVISIDFARTEPDALSLLISLSNSEVRVPYFEEVMNRRFSPATCFHAKTIIFDTDVGGRRAPLGLVVSSANLTLSGLSLGHENSLAIMWKKPLGLAVKTSHEAFIEEIKHMEALIDMATPINETMIRKYAKKRPKKQLRSEDDSPPVKRLVEQAPEVPLTKAVALASGQSLWVEVDYVVENRGKGLPGNQIDLQRGSRVFFGFGVGQVPANTLLGSVRIIYGSNAIDCHMRFGNNLMDKLNLPVPGVEGPPDYKNKTLLFKRQADGAFLLRVGSSTDAKEWEKISRTQGTLYEMQSGRKYGVFG